MNCCIFLHYMCLEERTRDELLDEGEEESSVIVGEGLNPMWCGLVRLTGQTVIPPGVGSIAALCEATRFMEDEKDNKRTKTLLVRHIWNIFGETTT